jgi:hypothetical protein
MKTKTDLPATSIMAQGILYRVRGHVDYEPPWTEYYGSPNHPATTWYEIDSIKVKDNSGAHPLEHSWVEIIKTIPDGPDSIYGEIEDQWVDYQKQMNKGDL